MVVLLVLASQGKLAVAQSVLVQADGALNVGYTQITQGTTQPDPNPQAPDVHQTQVSGLVTEFRPGILIQSGSPRLSWTAGYTFGANVAITGGQGASYSNQANVAAVASLTKFTTLTLSASFGQGGTTFLLSQTSAEAGQPALRAPGNPDTISATGVEAITWEAIPHVQVLHSLVASTSAPQDALDERSSSLTGSLAVERPFSRDIPGIELRANISWLRPLQDSTPPYISLSNALLGRLNHDFSLSWNGFISLGVENVFTDTGSKALAFLPTGSASLRYTYGDVGASLEFRHGSATNLQVGAVSLTDQLTGRGVFILDPRSARVISFSAGFLRNTPIGEVSPAVSAGNGDAFQGDASFTTSLARNLLFNVRYSIAYQFDQGGDVPPSLAHIFLVGVTGRYSNTERQQLPLPVRGRRVDGTDSIGFPVVDDRLEPDSEEPAKR
jgi:hypothetical protein